MRCVMTALAVVAGLMMAAVPALGHHSLFANFDETRTVTLNGVISKIEWLNPHVYLYMDVTDAAGNISMWEIETFPPSTLRRAGLTRDNLGLGENVTLVGYQSRNGSQTSFLRKMTFTDGRELVISLGDIELVQ